VVSIGYAPSHPQHHTEGHNFKDYAIIDLKFSVYQQGSHGLAEIWQVSVIDLLDRPIAEAFIDWVESERLKAGDSFQQRIRKPEYAAMHDFYEFRTIERKSRKHIRRGIDLDNFALPVWKQQGRSRKVIQSGIRADRILLGRLFVRSITESWFSPLLNREWGVLKLRIIEPRAGPIEVEDHVLS
jgi:hypothetical protein